MPSVEKPAENAKEMIEDQRRENIKATAVRNGIARKTKRKPSPGRMKHSAPTIPKKNIKMAVGSMAGLNLLMFEGMDMRLTPND